MQFRQSLLKSGKMIKEIIVVALALTFVECAKVIPIKKQGKNFPVPQANPDNNDDYFDDQFYPDINDEKIGEAPRDNRGKTGSGSTGTSSGSRPGGGRPGKGGKRPGQGSRRPSGTRPGQGGTATATPADTSSLRQRNPQKGQKGGRGNGQGLKAKYANTPAKYVFKSPHFNDAGITPTVKYFKTKNKEHIMTRGSPNDEFVLEILEGDPNGITMSIATIGNESRAILKNPNEKSIVGRVKTYKDGYRRSG